MENINYKFEVFEGPLELLLTLVAKHKLNIDDIPIDLLCEQYMAYMNEAAMRNVDLACEFAYMASELMLIKSRMLLPRDPVKDEDPRKPLIDAMVEYQRAKLAASELSDLYAEYGSRMIKEQDDIAPDRTYVANHSADLLRAALVHVLTETRFIEKNMRSEFEGIVNAPRIPVETVMANLIVSLRTSEMYLDSYFRHSESKQEIVAKFLSILELIKSHIVIVEESDDISDGITPVVCHSKIILIGTDEDIQAASLVSYA